MGSAHTAETIQSGDAAGVVGRVIMRWSLEQRSPSHDYGDFSGKGFTKNMYERLRQEVGWETNPIDGWLIHAFCFDDAGDTRMTNIWEETEKMEGGFVSRLMPVMRKTGFPPPQAQIYTAQHLNVFTTAD
jgi:hypothetical protein